ncbi:MAG: hypothetical protein U0797_01030 [Gemmataceae bacterium]
MRPSNESVARQAAGEMLIDVFAALQELGYTLSLDDISKVINRVQGRLSRQSSSPAPTAPVGPTRPSGNGLRVAEKP